MTLSIPSWLYDEMKTYKDIKWSEVARAAFENKIDELELIDDIKAMKKGLKEYKEGKTITHEELVKKLANISDIHLGQKTDKPSFTFLVGATEVSIPLSENIDLAQEKEKTVKELEHLKGFLNSVEKKLSNEKFMAGAPQNVVDVELKKKRDAMEKISLLEEKLRTL